jgi:nucleotide-binding universal stress UspA family protein
MEIFPALVCPAKWDKLMVCTDGSAEGQNAVAITLELARACASQVHVVQVLVQDLQGASNFRAMLVKEVQKNLEAIEVAAAKLQVPIQPVVPESQAPHVAITTEAEKIRPDLIIMGRRGKSALARLLMGNVTAGAIGRSPVNVLVVPLGAALGFHRLLVALDGSSYSEAAFRLGLAMAKQAESQLIGVAVAPRKGDIMEAKAIIQKMLAAAKQAGLPGKGVKGISPQGVAPDIGIVQEAIKKEVDLIIMGSYGRTGLEKLLMGSTTEKVIGKAPCPVLVVK